MTRVSSADFCTPTTFTTVSATTATTATACARPGHAYTPTVSAIAAQRAVLPTTKLQPAVYPQNGPSRSRP